MAETAVWVYAISRPRAQIPTVTGVSGEPIRLLHTGRLAAAVGSVDRDEYGEQPLRRNLEDLGWLDTKARLHHRVITSLMEAGPVVPMRLAILYDDDERVQQMLAEQEHEIEAALTAVSGRAEWGVKVFAGDPQKTDQGEAIPDPAPTRHSEVKSDRVGTAYLERKRAGLRAREASRRSHATVAQSVYDEARHFAVAGRQHALQDSALRGDSREMLLNAAFLVEDERRDEFAAAMTALDGTPHGIDLQLTGPWPPYSFAFAGESP